MVGSQLTAVNNALSISIHASIAVLRFVTNYPSPKHQNLTMYNNIHSDYHNLKQYLEVVK